MMLFTVTFRCVLLDDSKVTASYISKTSSFPGHSQILSHTGEIEIKSARNGAKLMLEKAIWLLFGWILHECVSIFHKPQASENTTQECNIQPYCLLNHQIIDLLIDS